MRITLVFVPPDFQAKDANGVSRISQSKYKLKRATSLSGYDVRSFPA